MAKKAVSKQQKEQEEKLLWEAGSADMRKGAQELETKRDELLQEVLELQNELAGLETRKGELQTRLKHRMTTVVVCEKMIENFGKSVPDLKRGIGGA